jgi:serine/threonine-protein kinase HipA
MHGKVAGILQEILAGRIYRFTYSGLYKGEAISLNMPTERSMYDFNGFPSFFEGLLPEGHQLEGLLSLYGIDRSDLFSQLVKTGEDMPGCITVKEVEQ